MKIHEYMAAYRELGESITLKMHLLEDHTIAQIKKYPYGLAKLGEEGFELIHKFFKAFEEGTKNLSLPVLKSIMERHLMAVHPKVSMYYSEL